ncbi:MAG: DNA polymerase III subunit gamma/tau [Deltaproteobacteria bacterium]|nr:DNA polymerase III subunit gamma/tau [Deltaproteobacteria bacterium]
MSYQVLARKYRPQNFEEVVGQKHVTTTLENAIKQDRLHHAYLFTGVRGTGKTSLARILAKSLNCQEGPTVTPCGVCENCQAINQGQFLDVSEIDGASHTSVENVRELREQIKYLPAIGKYKIYIIDEVHMLSTSAFNALLKTLEEPPNHVMFIFATTEVHKLPVTILSRCQRFDLKRISQAELVKRLQWICDQEKVASSGQSLELLARAAEGSMRDAQSLLDMAIGQCGVELSESALLEMLGLVSSTWVEDITADCLKGELRSALQRVEDIYQRGYELRQIVVQWLEFVHDLTIVKSVGPDVFQAKFTTDVLGRMQKMVEDLELDHLQVFFQTLHHSVESIARSENPKILLDLLLVKLVHGSPYQSLAGLLGEESLVEKKSPQLSPDSISSRSRTSSSTPSSRLDSQTDSRVHSQNSASKSNIQAKSAVNTLEGSQKITSTGSEINETVWKQVLKKRPQVLALIQHAQFQAWEGDTYVLSFEKSSIWLDMLKDKVPFLNEALSTFFQKNVQVQLREEAGSAKETKKEDPEEEKQKIEDPVVRQAIDILNAKVKEVKVYGHE